MKKRSERAAPGAGRKERERARHRQEILAAAEAVFAQAGYHAATIETIARAADFSVGSLYNVFENKEHLYRELLESISREFRQELQARVAPLADPLAALEAVVELGFELQDRHGGLLRMIRDVLSGEAAQSALMVPKFCATCHAEYVDLLVEVFGRGMSRGAFDKADPLHMALCLDGMLKATAVYWVNSGGTADAREQLKKTIIDRFRPRQRGK